MPDHRDTERALRQRWRQRWVMAIGSLRGPRPPPPFDNPAPDLARCTQRTDAGLEITLAIEMSRRLGDCGKDLWRLDGSIHSVFFGRPVDHLGDDSDGFNSMGGGPAMNGPKAGTAGAEWIARLGLEAHPEGGWFLRIYTSAVTLVTPGGPRPSATSIHYLLTREQPLGRLHRNRSDILHFLIDGGPVEYLVVTSEGALQRVCLAHTSADRFLLVPGDCWKGSRLVGGVGFV